VQWLIRYTSQVGLDILFRVLHHRAVPTLLTLPQLSATARLVDKYQCVRVFSGLSNFWLDRHVRGIGADRTLPEYLGIAAAFVHGDIEAAVMLGVVMSTGRMNAATCEERIKATALGDLVHTEYCSGYAFFDFITLLPKTTGYMDRYRERVNLLFATRIGNLAAGLEKFRPAEELEVFPDHSENELSRHTEMVTSAFYRALSDAGTILASVDSTEMPLLQQTSRLYKLAKSFSADSRTNLEAGENNAEDQDCDACDFVTSFDDKVFEVFMGCIGCRSGLRSLGGAARKYCYVKLAHRFPDGNRCSEHISTY
jgi:hypothetical protein